MFLEEQKRLENYSTHLNRTLEVKKKKKKEEQEKKTSEAYHHTERRKTKYVSADHTKIHSDFSLSTWIRENPFWGRQILCQKEKAQLHTLLNTRDVNEKDITYL